MYTYSTKTLILDANFNVVALTNPLGNSEVISIKKIEISSAGTVQLCLYKTNRALEGVDMSGLIVSSDGITPIGRVYAPQITTGESVPIKHLISNMPTTLADARDKITLEPGESLFINASRGDEHVDMVATILWSENG